MTNPTRALALAIGFVLTLAVVAAAQSPRISYPDSLRADWTVEPTRPGRARVVGYLYNSNVNDAANVWLRVERIGADGSVADTYRWRVVGDVLSGGRSLFDVPVGEAAATYRVMVETVSWVKECR
ncbi:MAG TPA: hypothetical protein VFS98_18990 [Methylomirabilota bacterium]|nr:hypothetical protein [Methylomirabilota bacterium]